MLLLDSAVELRGVTVFRDHVAPSTFHYLPGRPRLVGPGGIALLLYRGPVGGGLLTLDVDLAIAPSVLADLRADLGTRFGGPVDLVPVLFDEGTVRLTTLGVAGDGDGGPAGGGVATGGPSRLVEQVLATATPSLLGAGRATFSVRLDREGAVLMHDATTTGVLPVVVAYELAYRGLRPASGLRAEVDQRMAYEYLRTRAAANTLWFKADIDREAEALQRAGHLTVTDVDYDGTDPDVLAARREVALETLRELVDTVFFRPATSPASLSPTGLAQRGVDASWAANGRPQAAFVLRSLQQDEQQHASYDRSEISAAQLRVAPQGSVVLPAGLDPQTVVREIDLVDDGAPVTVTVAAPEGADWAGVSAIQVDLRGGDQTRTVVLDNASPTASAVLPAGPLEHQLTVLTDRQPGDLGSPPVNSQRFRPLQTTALVLDPAAVAGRRTVLVTLGAFAPDLLTAATCRLTASPAADTDHDAGQTSFVLRPDHPATTVAVWGAPLLTLHADLSTTAGPVAITQPVPAGQSVAVVNLPRDRFQQVVVTLQDPLDRYQAVDVELEARSGGTRHAVSLNAAAPSASWTRVRRPDDPATYRYRVTRLRRDGLVTTDDWAEAAGSLLVVGDRDLRVDQVTVVLAGWVGLVGALLTLTSLEPPPGVPATAEVLLQGEARQATVRLAFRRTAPRRYRLSGQVFLADTAIAVAADEESSEVLILTPARDPGR